MVYFMQPFNYSRIQVLTLVSLLFGTIFYQAAAINQASYHCAPSGRKHT
jgi:hypothetical protein